MKLLDLDSWPRKEHFNFFSQFTEPLFGVCVEVDCTRAYHKAEELDASFFLYYMHKSLVAVNQTECFKYRINADNQIIIHDVVSCSATIARENGTFGFSYSPYNEDFNVFTSHMTKEIDRIRNSTNLIPAHVTDDVIHYSSLPWIKFTSISHARNYAFQDSVPKISFGKMTTTGNTRTMPVSIHVHHGLMDGLHVGQYIDLFQNLLND